MTLQSDHKALIFVGAIAVLGAGVRVVRAAGGSTSATQPALEHQMQAADSAKRVVAGKKSAKKRATPESGRVAAVSRDGPGRRTAKLDLDVATAAQMDSLPGMSPSLAKRIVTDRMQHGPFLGASGLRRVKGVTPKLLRGIDSLVVFSGIISAASSNDTIVARSRTPSGARRTP
jgi:DNA uptake protein ComE-like DNA-binding protein